VKTTHKRLSIRMQKLLNSMKTKKRTNDLKEEFPNNQRGVSLKIAEYLIDKHKIKTIDGEKPEMYLYREGIFEGNGSNRIKSEIQSILEDKATTHIKNEIVNIIKDKTLVDRKVFNPPKDLICFANGVYDSESEILTDHAWVYNFTSKIPIKYDPNATCPNIEKFLKSILDKESRKLIYELAGFTLYRRYFIKKAFIFYGEGDTGKTTMMEFLKKFIGADNVTSNSLHNLTRDRFAKSNLYSKHLNIYDDLESQDITNHGIFKMLVGDGTVSGEKKYGSTFIFNNFAKLVFAANRIPQIKDNSDTAYFNRWIVIKFEKKIEKIDPYIIEKITTREELSGFLNLALKGLKRVAKQGFFSYSRTIEEIQQEIQEAGNAVIQFLNSELEEREHGVISKNDMSKAICHILCSKTN